MKRKSLMKGVSVWLAIVCMAGLVSCGNKKESEVVAEDYYAADYATKGDADHADEREVVEKTLTTDAVSIDEDGEIVVDVENDNVSIEKTEDGETIVTINTGDTDVKLVVKEDANGKTVIDTTKTVSEDGKKVVEVSSVTEPEDKNKENDNSSEKESPNVPIVETGDNGETIIRYKVTATPTPVITKGEDDKEIVTAPGKTSTPVPSLTPVATSTQVPTEPTKKPAEPSVTETPVPTAQVVPGTTGTPTPTVKENTPTVKGSTPTPTVKVNTPTPTVKVNTPTPTVKVNTPTPTVKTSTPTPTVKVNTPTPTQTNTPTPTVKPCSHTWKRLIKYDLRDTSGYVTIEGWDEDIIIGTQMCKMCRKTAYDLGYEIWNKETGQWISTDNQGWNRHCENCMYEETGHIGNGYFSYQQKINTIHHPSTTEWVESSTYYVQTYAWKCEKCGEVKASDDLSWITQIDALEAGWFN